MPCPHYGDREALGDIFTEPTYSPTSSSSSSLHRGEERVVVRGTPNPQYAYHQNAARAICDMGRAAREGDPNFTPLLSKKEQLAKTLQMNKIRAKQGFFADMDSYRHMYGMGAVRLAQLRLHRFIQMAYNGVHWVLEKFQIDLANAMIQAFVPLIVGEEAMLVIGDQIRHELNIGANLHTLVFATATRRSGKTIGMVVMLMALIFTRPGTVVNIYSNAKRGADNIRDLIFEAMAALDVEDLIQGRSRRAEEIHFGTIFKKAPASIIRFLPGDDKMSTLLSLSLSLSLPSLFCVCCRSSNEQTND